MNFTEFIKPELLVIIPVLNLIGSWIKKSKKVNDKYIPFILGAVGVLLAGAYVFLSDDFSTADGVATPLFTAITQGLLCAAASVYANQLYKQINKENED